MIVEFTHADLEALLEPELGRFHFYRDNDGWVASDPVNDDIYRAPTRDGLIRKLAIASDYVDVTGRPQFNGRSVLVAEVQPQDDGYVWVIFDCLGRCYTGPDIHAERDRALRALHDEYQAAKG